MPLINKLKEIADAIREKRKTTDVMTLDEMAKEIKDIVHEPYVEEFFDEEGYLIDVRLHGYTSIRNGMFLSEHRVKWDNIPDFITSIGNSAFANSGIETMTIHDQVTFIGTNAFDSCSYLETVTFLGTDIKLAGRTFYACAFLENVVLPSNLT